MFCLKNVTRCLSVVIFFIFGVDCSPIQDSLDSAGVICPKGWFHTDNFCVSTGLGDSEKGVAKYCDKFGGIGVKGLCIIRALQDEEQLENIPDKYLTDIPDSDVPNSKDVLLELLNLKENPKSAENQEYSLYSFTPPSWLSRLRTSDILSDDSDNIIDSAESIDTRLCPSGWEHYRSMCIYKPLTLDEQCQKLGATEFHGLCIKHADSQALASSEKQNYHRNGKRVCCCAHPKAQQNRYAC